MHIYISHLPRKLAAMLKEKYGMSSPENQIYKGVFRSIMCALFALNIGLLGACSQQNTQRNDHLAAITSDPVSVDANYPPVSIGLDFVSHGSALNGQIYLADGAGPHPTVILLHGLPGYEKNLDIAQAIRRAGYNVLFFHYRGAWGSEGDFSFTHTIEDVLAASAFLRRDESITKYRTDPTKVIFLGHSMGGFTSLAAGALDKETKCVAAMSPVDYGIFAHIVETESGTETLEKFIAYIDGQYLSGSGPLQGTSAKHMLQDVFNHRESFSLTHRAEEFSDRRVFLSAANKDTVLPPKIYHSALVTAFEANPKISLTHKIFEGDHNYSWSRIALSEDIVQWLNENCR